MPCVFHKTDGRLCEDCEDYSKISSRILVVKLGAIGDVLRTTSILPALQAKYPGCEITWITKKNAADLLELNPRVDQVLMVEHNYLEFLGNESFSVGICLDADPLSANIHSLAHCDERFGFTADHWGRVIPANNSAEEWWLMGVNDAMKRKNRKSYYRIMYEICELPLPLAPPELHLTDTLYNTTQRLQKWKESKAKKTLVGINTGGGARWQFKKWTFEGYVECITSLRERIPDTGLVLLGGPEEIDLNRQIMGMLGEDIFDGGCDNSLLEFASIIQMLDVLLRSDSLAMHIGVALKIPTLVLVGPTSPWELDIFGRGAILHSDINCLACYLSHCDKKVNCMNTIESPRVVDEILRFLPK
jgi:heptosyltransferase-2